MSSGRQINPYSQLDMSQIEYTNTKRDYSPIITTSKYDLRRIYDPKGQNEAKKQLVFKSQNFQS